MRPDRDTHRVVKAATTLARMGIALLLGYAGILKLQNPDAPREFIASVLYADLPWIVGLVAVSEILLAAWLLLGYRAGRAATVAFALFLSFGILHAFASAAPDTTGRVSCGCLGEIEAIEKLSPGAWIAFNAGFAMLCGLVAMTSKRPAAAASEDDPTVAQTHEGGTSGETPCM